MKILYTPDIPMRARCTVHRSKLVIPWTLTSYSRRLRILIYPHLPSPNLIRAHLSSPILIYPHLSPPILIYPHISPILTTCNSLN